jgi:hypothetical protein
MSRRIPDAVGGSRVICPLHAVCLRSFGLSELVGEPVTGMLTVADHGRPVGGIKVVTEHGWFAARPSGTEAVYKLPALRQRAGAILGPGPRVPALVAERGAHARPRSRRHLNRTGPGTGSHSD